MTGLLQNGEIIKGLNYLVFFLQFCFLSVCWFTKWCGGFLSL